MRSKRMIALGLLGLLAAACTGLISGSTASDPPSSTWIDAPLQGSILPLAPYTIVFHASSPAGISEFEVSINGVVDTIATPLGGQPSREGTLSHGNHTWNPPAPGTFLIAVRAKPNGGGFGPATQVQVTVYGESLAEATPTATPTATVEPTERPCTFEALVKLNCRKGPGLDFSVVDSFNPGQVAPVIGVSAVGEFWYVLGPNLGRVCTVPQAARFGQVSGDCSKPPRFTPQPSPTATATPAPGCIVTLADGTQQCVAPCPPGIIGFEPCLYTP